MDNPLTPKKIQKLINLAEGRSYNIERLLLTEDDVKLIAATQASMGNTPKYESSSGIIDLDHVEGFGESCSIGNMSLSKSTAFNPGEMTGRSTGADDVPSKSTLGLPNSEQYGRHSIALDSITSKMDKQTSEINDLMRHSIATNYSFHSKRDLTADEHSLIQREAPMPILQTTHTYFGDSVSVSNSNLSVGAYFKNRCVDFGKILGKTDSPDKSSMMPSITEVSSSTHYDHGKDADLIKIDEMLDSVPVKQPRNTDTGNFEKPKSTFFLQPTSTLDKTNRSIFKEPKLKPVDKPEGSLNRVQEKPIHGKNLNPASYAAHKSFLTSSKPTDVLLKNLQSSFKLVSDDTEEGSVENSFSISKIADYLGKQSNISVTDMLQLQKRKVLNKHPLTELHLNNTQKADQVVHVTRLIDTKKTDTASSAGTVNTVISMDKLRLDENKKKLDGNKNVPEVVVTQHVQELNAEDKRATRSKSPSSKSPSTLSTVRDNYASFKSGDSPDSSKEQWVEIITKPVEGFVGVTAAVTIAVTTLSDSWLTAKFQFDNLPNDGKDINVELPRLPLLLSPGKTENLTFHLTSNVEMNTVLPFTFFVKDASIDGDVEQKGELQVEFKIPVIQAMSADGLNRLTYPIIAERAAITKWFVLISDCPADLQLKLSIVEGDSMFSIKNVQEVKKSDVNKVLLERQSSEETGKPKAKTMNKQLCRLVSGSAIRVAITFNAPKLADLKISDPTATFNGVLHVTLISGSTVLRKVDLISVVGTPKLAIKSSGTIVTVTNEATPIDVTNTGAVAGSWSVKYKPQNNVTFPFKITPSKFDLAGAETKTLHMVYVGPAEEGVVQLPIRFEEVSSGQGPELILSGGADKPKSFPIKTNHTSLSWVRAGRKEVSLKNIFDKKIHVRCHIVGDGFTIDLPGGETRGVYVLSFNACECRPLPIVFTPSSCIPHSATLHMAYDRNSEFSRKIKLFGCMSGEPVRWSGLVTYSDTAALVRAAGRAPVDLKLHNKSTMPAFIAARVHFNLQYMQVASSSRLAGARRVVAGRAAHALSLRLDWPRLERRARAAATTALATVTVLTGAEVTRRRILKVLKDESNGKLDTSLLPEHLRVLTEEFDGEDDSLNHFLNDFNETKASLNELIGGLQELTAHIELPQDFAEETTIVISDDTVLDHHTICD
ncbi:uncharacterized protein LOC126373545 isoform X2 [Pectinophora gossypiella]|uniref:uncharacterized protein LOC126373545 isoform X2 n=1 Tax=Pectinophora gossypiella TaxID=13191 RepID=UPI00214E7729|nr:uncharacterized protein LOC126373545 isoform X2 [Pectinophora gossypiella]